MNNDKLITYSNKVKNSVQERYTGKNKEYFLLQNRDISLEYALSPSLDQKVCALKNSKGVPYIENTFDAFVKMQGGDVYYASKPTNSTNTNIFRFGYYYHDLRLEGQNFLNGITVRSEESVPLEVTRTNDLLDCDITPDKITATIGDTKDPYVALGDMCYDTAKFNCVQVKVKTSIENSFITLFVAAGKVGAFNHRQVTKFDLNGDGEFHTYTVFLANIPDYTAELRGLRFDLDGGQIGKSVEITDVKLLSAEEIGVSSLSMARVFHTYPDKLHHELQVVAHRTTDGIESIGTVTEIDKSKVSAIAIKDKFGVHPSLDNIDWNSIECVGFDINDAGVFGFIIPVRDDSGRVTVSDDGKNYVIVQERTPVNNTVYQGNSSDIGNTNDFYMGCRIYTDESHDFVGLMRETLCERVPLGADSFKIDEAASDNAIFLGYNALRGSYEFKLDGTDFNSAYFNFPNKHFCLKFNTNAIDNERNIYVVAKTAAQHLESAVLLGEDDLLLPVPIEVTKNFSGDGDANIYNLLDTGYGEAIFPICIDGEEHSYKVAQIYQNWGKYPLKQYSSIQFYAPYYHISTGVTETNCIKYRFTNDNVLPDHRAMSAPVWSTQPQHTSGGFNSFIRYVTPDAIIAATNVSNHLGSYGPTYADVDFDYITNDGKIAIRYSHLEFPQTDETRTYYTFEHTVLEDIEFDDFKNQFSFYSMSDKDPAGDYQKIGYLDENDNPTIVGAMPHKTTAIYKLGKNCPYFDVFDLIDCMGEPSKNYVNLGIIVCDPEFVIGGEKVDMSFALRDAGGKMHLTLDAEKLSLKKGDKISFKAILLPWGSQECDFSGEDFAPDVNVRAVRENTLLNRAKVTPVSDCEAISTPFLPSVKALNGRSAEFKLSGGENNIAVRIYGVEKLARPTVYELVAGEWAKYELSSKDTPDAQGNYHEYDGYNVFYDEDGSYSYSFVVTMNGGKERRFKIEI